MLVGERGGDGRMEEQRTRKEFEAEERSRTAQLFSMPSYEHVEGLAFSSREPSLPPVWSTLTFELLGWSYR